MNKVKFLLAALALCIGFSSCHVSRHGPGRPYRQYKHAYHQDHHQGEVRDNKVARA